MSRILIAAALSSMLAACAGQAASPSEVVSEAAATPSPSEQPTPTPTPDPAAFGEAYLATSVTLAVSACAGQAIVDAAPDDLAAWSEAMAIIGPGLAAGASTLRPLEPPPAVKDDVEMLLQAFDERAAAAEAITTASTIDEVYELFDTTFATTGVTLGQAADAIRAKLDLPPRDTAPCD